MDSSSQPANSADQPPPRWAEILGAVIAVVTLIVPLVAIAHFSSSSNVDFVQQTSYSLPKPED